MKIYLVMKCNYYRNGSDILTAFKNKASADFFLHEKQVESKNDLEYFLIQEVELK